MPKITIDLPADTNAKLKLKAKADYRSLTNYITTQLIKLANDELNLSQSQSQSTLTLAQLQEQGLAAANLKFQKPVQSLTPEEQELQQLKLDKQKSDLKQKRIMFLRKECQRIFGYLLPYIENNNTRTIDSVLDKYPTDEDITKYLTLLHEEDENLPEEQEDKYLYETEINELEQHLPHPLHDYYKKTKEFCIENDYTNELYQMLKYPDYNAWTEEQCQIVCSALNADKKIVDETNSWDEIVSYFRGVEEV